MGELNADVPLLSITGASWKGLRYGCTTRHGGVSQGPWATLNVGMHVGDEPAAVEENRRRLSVGLPGEPCWLEQVHGTEVVQTGKRGLSHPPKADAAVTVEPGVVLAIMTADCLPVVLADLDGRALGVAHAGWRGLAAGVLESTLAELKVLMPKARGWRAWIGPSISQKNFEVGDEVRQVFMDADPAASAYFVAGATAHKWQADLSGLAVYRLATAGVYDVETSGLCSYECDKLFHSYRRSPVCGRMATLAWLDHRAES